MDSRAPVTVAIIDDDRLIREGLAALINGSEGYRCAGAFRSMEEALAQPWKEIPDIALVDIGLPGTSGIQGLSLLRAKYPAVALLMLTVYEDDERIFEALCAGASGYLLKKTPPGKLLESLREALDGGAPMSPEVARRVVRLFREIRQPERMTCDLTPHELRLLKLLVEGHNYQSAAAELGVSFSTINFHMQNIYAKLQVHSKSEAVAKALRHNVSSRTFRYSSPRKPGNAHRSRNARPRIEYFSDTAARPRSGGDMKRFASKTGLLAGVMGLALLAGSAAMGQRPKENIAPRRHPNLAAAERLSQQAWQRIVAAQEDNEWDMQGHAQKAKELLDQANKELKLAAETANRNRR